MVRPWRSHKHVGKWLHLMLKSSERRFARPQVCCLQSTWSNTEIFEKLTEMCAGGLQVFTPAEEPSQRELEPAVLPQLSASKAGEDTDTRITEGEPLIASFRKLSVTGALVHKYGPTLGCEVKCGRNQKNESRQLPRTRDQNLQVRRRLRQTW